jgi:hypothetical protein
MMGVEDMPDERLAHFYENIPQQVEANRANKHQFMANPTVRQYADRLRSELIKRDYITRRSNGPRSIAALTTLPGSRLPRRAALILLKAGETVELNAQVWRSPWRIPRVSAIW